MNLCESCKELECSFRKDGWLVHACHSHDPITIADLAAKDAYWQDRIVRERKETQDLYANGVLTAIAPLAERPCIGAAAHGTGFVLVGRVWHEESEVRKAAESLGLREPPAVVVPELTEDDAFWHGQRWLSQRVEDRGPAFPGLQQIRRAFREGYELASSRATPADRVLGDGMVAVGREELEALRECADAVLNSAPEKTWSRNDTYLTRAARKIAALRANQGGAEHGNV